MAHIMLDVYGYNDKKLCSLYDSSLENTPGQAYDITYTDSINGQKTQVFTLPYLCGGKKNFRWDYIKSEYLVRLRMGSETDWFIIHAPKKIKSSRTISNTVTCDHLSSVLKTKNLYLGFDDENGIGTITHLLEQVLKGTGWKLGKCDTMMERDGEKEKVRSLTSEGKDGALQLITEICSLFYAYPVFNGDDKTVDIRSLNNKGPMFEMTMGRDLDSLSVEFNSNDIITRLYVEGEYGEFGYVGIDDVNPTGLPFLMNFEYYKQIGLFTEEHQQALDEYYAGIQAVTEKIKTATNAVIEKENRLNELWGQIDYVIWKIQGGTVAEKLVIGDVREEMQELKFQDQVTILQADGKYRTEKIASSTPSFGSSDQYVIKFITLPNAMIGAKEVAIEAKQRLIESLNSRIEKETNQARKESLMAEASKYEIQIQELYDGNEETPGLYAMMHEAANLVYEIEEYQLSYTEAIAEQDDIDAEFAVAMEGLLKEGYWNDANYTIGQEESLYADAQDMMEIMSKPEIKYVVSMKSLANQFKYKQGDLKVNMKIRLYDPDLGVNDIVYISDVTRVQDKPHEDTVTLSNEDIRLTGMTLDSILSRMTRLADLIDQKNALYNRAEAISPDGSIYIDRLEGTINVLKSKLVSATSSWYTDNNGNLVFESANGRSAMMITGEGFMISDGKNEDGTWNYRVFGTGEGFTADALTTGYLSADRIEARSITADKLTSNIGESLDLSSNVSIKAAVESEIDNAHSTIVQTAEEVSVSFHESLMEKLDEIETDLNNYQNDVSTYIRFNKDGMTLGKESSNIQAALDNDKLAFIQENTEVAYISDKKLYIPEASITNRIAIGNTNNGYFDFVTLPTGIAIIWRDYD